jgi:hypothetical protein
MILLQHSNIPIYSDLFGMHTTSDFQNNYNDIENQIYSNLKKLLPIIIHRFGKNIKEDSFEFDNKRYDYLIVLDNINPRILKIEILGKFRYFDREPRIHSTHKIEKCVGRISTIQLNCTESLFRYSDEITTRLSQHIEQAYRMLERMFYNSFENNCLISHVNNLVTEILMENNQQETLTFNFWAGTTDVTGNSNKSKFWKYFFSRDSIKNIFDILKSHQVDRHSPFELYLRLANSGGKDLMLNECTETNWFFSKLIKDINDEEYSEDIKEAESSLFFRKEMPDNIAYATSYIYENTRFHIHITYPKVFEDNFINTLKSARPRIKESIDTFLLNADQNENIYTSINSINESLISNISTQELDYYARKIAETRKYDRN